MKLKDYLRNHVTWKAVAAALLSLFTISATFALSVDQTRIFSKRDLGIQAMHYYRLTINYNDPNIASGLAFGALGANTYIYAVDCHVTTTFNASTTNVITLGTSKANANEISASGTLNPASGTVQHLTTAVGLGLGATSGGDVTLYTKYTQTGTAATQGQVTCVIQYAPNNDM
jgi:hypothetical protein